MQAKLKLRDKDFIIETGKMAKQADGAVTVQYGDTVILTTVVSPEKPREGVDFLPLSVDYREKTSAAGRFPGGYIKREARPTEKEILSSRLIDRPIRPLFPEGYFYEIQIMSAVLSADGINDPDILAINGASCALTISDIPFYGPIGAVRIGRVNEKFIVNPTHSELENSDLDMVFAGTQGGISMIEGLSKELPEDTMLEAARLAHKHIVEIIKLQFKFQKSVGKPKREVPLVKINEELLKKIEEKVSNELDKVMRISEKIKRQDALANLLQKTTTELQPEFPEATEGEFAFAFHKIEKQKIRNLVLKEKKRCDGRTPTEIRPITCEIGLLPRTHGSALFTRGETQSLAVTTLGTVSDEQRTEGYTGESSKTFMLHYNFPPFSVGEARPVRGPGRREIGHGALAERALLAVMPLPQEFPYTVRIVSDILESNGSSSMASICGGCLSLMDAGVPIKDIVAGIAMGLITDKDNLVILTDILGAEDACGDMDFKVAGTKKGITAFQLDIKLKEGLSLAVLKKGMEQARVGRLFIIDKMSETIQAPRENVSVHAPKIQTIQIDTNKIGAVIGPGGKNIKRIIEETGATIEIEDDGKVIISSTDDESINKATTTIKQMTQEAEVGTIYEGTVKSIMDFGAFVEIFPGASGLVHISELADRFVKKVEDVVQIGDEIKVIVTEIDNKGRINLSKKQVDKQADQNEDKS